MGLRCCCWVFASGGCVVFYSVAGMTKVETLEVIKLLSALESWSFAEKHSLPDYLYEKITLSMEVLEKELLK